MRLVWARADKLQIETSGKMGKSGKALAMDLIRWIWLFLGSLGTRRLRPENPEICMDVPLTRLNVVPVRVSSGRRLSRGPNAPNQRANL